MINQLRNYMGSRFIALGCLVATDTYVFQFIAAIENGRASLREELK